MLRLPLLQLLARSRSLKVCSHLHTTTPAPMDLRTLVRVLDRLAPLRAAESWDNVGLLVEPSSPPDVKTLLITNDLTEQVLEEALENSPGLIISYHPPIFKALKRLTQASVKERLMIKAIEEGIAVYSPHTSLDNMEGGINDWLLSGVGEGEVRALGLNKHPARFPHILEFSHKEGDKEMIKEDNLPSGAYIGVGEFQFSESNNFTCRGMKVECTDEGLITFLPAIRRKFPSIQVSISSNHTIETSLSGGKMLTLMQAVSLSEIVKRVKAHLKLEHLRLARPYNTEDDPVIRTVAACAGSGGSVLEGVGADLLLTGEMSHHQVLAATARGSAVILCDHTNTERGFLQGKYRQWVEDAVGGKVQVRVASTDKDPLCIV